MVTHRWMVWISRVCPVLPNSFSGALSSAFVRRSCLVKHESQLIQEEPLSEKG